MIVYKQRDSQVLETIHILGGRSAYVEHVRSSAAASTELDGRCPIQVDLIHASLIKSYARNSEAWRELAEHETASG